MVYYPTAYTSEETDGIYATNSGITDGDSLYNTDYKSGKGDRDSSRYHKGDDRSSLVQQAYYGKDIDLKAYGDLDKTQVEYDPNYNPNVGSNGDLYIDIYNEGYGYPWFYSSCSTWGSLCPWYSGYGTWDYLYPWYYPGYRYWGVGRLYYTGDWIRDRDIPRRTYLKNPRYDSQVRRYRRDSYLHKLGETNPYRYNTGRSNSRKAAGKNPRYDHRKYTRAPAQRNNASRTYHRNAVPRSNPSTVGSHKSRGRSAPLRYHRR